MRATSLQTIARCFHNYTRASFEGVWNQPGTRGPAVVTQRSTGGSRWVWTSRSGDPTMAAKKKTAKKAARKGGAKKKAAKKK
jgi:hypothetical protein